MLVSPPVAGSGVLDKLRAPRSCPRSARHGVAFFGVQGHGWAVGVTENHLRGSGCDEVATHLTQVVQLLARGEALAELAPHLAGATLHALPKGEDDFRPIAVSETLRRLVSKCLPCCQARGTPSLVAAAAGRCIFHGV